MADNVAVTPGAGATIATDDVGGIQYQIVKIAIGSDGSALLLSPSNPVPAVIAVRRDADNSPLVVDGEPSLLLTDEGGRLKVSSKPATYIDITGDITATQATIGTPVAGGTVAGDVSRASNIMAFCSGTFNAVSVSFEGSIESAGDTNWFSVQAVRSNANTIETSTGSLSAQPTYAWELSVNALKRVRVRCTARTSGTQSWRFVLGTYATEPIPAAQISGTQPVSGTVTVNGTVTSNIGTGSVAAGTNAIGDIGVQYRANATGAASLMSVMSPLTPAVGTVKATAGRLLGWQLHNSSAAVRSVKIFNATAPILGTTAAAFEIDIPAGGRSEIQLPGGIGFATAIVWSATSAKGLTDNTATGLAATDVSGAFFFA